MAKKVEKNQLRVRWLVLFLACMLMIGNYYCYDNPSALNTQLDNRMDSKDYAIYFNLLYSVYSFPNIILPFFGGFFVDKFGPRICMIVFGLFILVGQTVFAFGCSTKSWAIMLLGRVIFGFGGESLTVGQSALLADWFKGKELAFAFGINLSIARLGSVINNNVSPEIADATGDVSYALWFGVLVCGMSLICAGILAPIDKAAEANDERYSELVDPATEQQHQRKMSSDREDRISRDSVGRMRSSSTTSVLENVSMADVKNFRKAFWLLTCSCLVVYGCVLPFNNVASAFLLERDYFQTQPSDCALVIPTDCYANTTRNEYCETSDHYEPPVTTEGSKKIDGVDAINCDDADKNGNLWLPKDSADQCNYKYYCDAEVDAEKTVGKVMSIPYIISAILSPLLGYAVDKIGLRAVIATAAPAVLIFVHTSLAVSDMGPVVPLIFQGVAYSAFAAALWPSVPYCVEKHQVGLAYGVITAIQNGGLALFPVIVGTIYKANGDKYIPSVELFFVGLAAFGFLIGLALNYDDKQHGSPLNRTYGDDGDAAEGAGNEGEATLNKALLADDDDEGCPTPINTL